MAVTLKRAMAFQACSIRVGPCSSAGIRQIGSLSSVNFNFSFQKGFPFGVEPHISRKSMITQNYTCFVPKVKCATFGDWTMMSSVMFVKTATR